MKALAIGCALAAVVIGLRELRGGRGGGRGPRGVARRVAARYARSRAGRRLSARLWLAQVHMSPAAWRCAQVLVVVPVATLLLAAGAPIFGAMTAAATATRSGGALLLWTRRRTATHALNEGAPVLARALATELAAWGSGAQAIAGACARCGDGRAPLAVAHVLQAAAARVLLGGDASSSLRRALTDAAPGLRDDSPAARVAAVFALHRHDGAATATALERLATALDDESAAHRDARAAVAEVRMSAVAVPLIAAATLATLLATDPPALAAALSLPVLPFLGIAVMVVLAASAGARRLVST